MEMMKTKDIKTHEAFSSLFPINDKVLESIQEHINSRHFFHSHPIELALWLGQKEPVVVDGHTRLQAAKNLGLEEVPIFFHEFDSEDEAFTYCVHCQLDRRNLAPAELHSLIQKVDQRYKRGEDLRSESNSKGSREPIERQRSAEVTAKTVGVSPTTVKRSRAISTDPEVEADVKSGAIKSLKEGAAKALKRRTTKKSRQKNSTRSAHCVRATTNRTRSDEESEDRQVIIPEDLWAQLAQLGGSVSEHVLDACRVYLAAQTGQEKRQTGLMRRRDRVTRKAVHRAGN